MKKFGLAFTQALILLCLGAFLTFRSIPSSIISSGISTVQRDIPDFHGISTIDDLSVEASQTVTSTEALPISTSTSSTTEPLEFPSTSTSTDIEPSETSIETNTDASPVEDINDHDALDNAPVYIQAILNTDNNDFPRLSCPAPEGDRFDYLKSSKATDHILPQYFFALDLYQSAPLLPRLLGSIIETIRFLGPERCVLSIVEGRSTDGTFEILNDLYNEMESLGAQYFFTRNNVNPKAGADVDRIQALADLRNQALAPLTEHPDSYDPNTTVVFINDIALCMEDILELIHQREYQKADMTCAMDWIYGGSIFYDVWVSRGMNGDQFFEIPQSGTWDYSANLFWNDDETRKRFEQGQAFQVFSCWNGATAFTAKPLMEKKIEFRSAKPDECYLGEPTHFCKDMWQLGYGKIAVIPTVNVGYNDDESKMVKDVRGSVSTWIEKETIEENLITWKNEPPKQIKCVPTYDHPSWVAWDQ